MPEFNREERYTVLKHTDVHDALDADDTELLIALEETVARYRKDKGKEPLACVVVESDWPEYEPTWQAIQNRVLREKHDTKIEVLAEKYREALVELSNVLAIANCLDVKNIYGNELSSYKKELLNKLRGTGDKGEGV